MQKFKIKYQDGNIVKELILETENLSNEKLPINIIEISKYKSYFDFKLFKIFLNLGSIQDFRQKR